MRATLWILFAVVLGYLATGTVGAGCHSTDPSFGPPNNFTIQDWTEVIELVDTVSNGALYRVYVENGGGNATSNFTLLHVWGTPYEWGYAHGTLLKDSAQQVADRVWAYMESEVESYLQFLPDWLAQLIADIGLDAALDFTELVSEAYTNPDYFAELHGLCDASGADYKTVLRIHMIAGLTEGKCSMFGAWGGALDPNSGIGLLQLRALDWDMDGPFRDYNQITVYHPSNSTYGHAHLLVGFTGFIGGLTGMSATQLGISEIGVSYPDSTFGDESRIGLPFIFLLRDILKYDYTVDDAINRMINTKRTCDLILGVGDGKLGLFRGMEYSSSVLDVFDDQNIRPNATWHPVIDDVVYWGMDWICPGYNLVLSELLQKYWGSITPEIAVAHISAEEQSGDNHIAFYDLTNMQLYVSVAAPWGVGGSPNAYARQYTRFDVNALFAEQAPGSRAN